MISEFANRLQDVAKVKKIDQIDLAKALGLDKSTVNRWWKGRAVPRPKSVRKIADYLGCSYDYLNANEGPMFPSTEEHQDTSSDIDPETFGDIQKWLNDQEKEKPGFNNWFKIEFRNRFPEFDTWEKKKEE